jgi:hypothetical protein
MTKPVLTVLDNEFTIYRFRRDKPVPRSVYESPFYWVGKTDEELSIVSDSGTVLDGGERNTGWSCIKAIGPIDFSATGILAALSAVLAEARISIFALSTYNTDFILVKTVQLERAITALGEAGYTVQKV